MGIKGVNENENPSIKITTAIKGSKWLSAYMVCVSQNLDMCVTKCAHLVSAHTRFSTFVGTSECGSTGSWYFGEFMSSSAYFTLKLVCLCNCQEHVLGRVCVCVCVCSEPLYHPPVHVEVHSYGAPVNLSFLSKGTELWHFINSGRWYITTLPTVRSHYLSRFSPLILLYHCTSWYLPDLNASPACFCFLLSSWQNRSPLHCYVTAFTTIIRLKG